jgi:hypothetical protein
LCYWKLSPTISSLFFQSADDDIIGDDVAYMAILAVFAAYLIRWCNDSRPDGSCRALRDRLPLERPFAFGSELLVHLVDHRFQTAPVHVPA